MSDGTRARVALVNDDTTFLELLRELLEVSEGYDVAVCKEGDRAFEFVKAYQPDVVLLDIRMGSEEIGWTILELLTLDPKTRPIPVIVCSAAVDQLWAHESQLRQVGVEVLPKPFDLDALLEKVKAALAKRAIDRGVSP